MKGKQFCQWHWLARQSSDVQAAHSVNRRLSYRGLPRARVPKSEWPEGQRWCAGCQSFIPDFYASGSRCRACASMAAHGRRLEDTYGITADDYADLLKRQGGRCAICRAVPRTNRLATDHDHRTGEVRGLLCKRCNHDLLGGSHDSVRLLWAAITYLLYPPAGGAEKPGRDEIMFALGARLDQIEAARQAASGPG